MNNDLSCVVSAKIDVKNDENLPADFKVVDGLRFHLWFNNESHPACIQYNGAGISRGQKGNVDIMFVAIENEKSVIKPGLKIQCVGGLKLTFAEGEVVSIKSMKAG